MFRALLQIKNYKLFAINMMLLGMAIAITIPFSSYLLRMNWV